MSPHNAVSSSMDETQRKRLLAEVQGALDAASTDAIRPRVYSQSVDHDRLCGHAECERPSHAAGLCNAHYIRKRTGRDMDAPMRPPFVMAAVCTKCGDPLNGKGGWGLCSKHYKRQRAATIKAALIQAMGGCCQRCEGVFHPAAFDFHHLGDKDDAPSSVIASAGAEGIANELAKCILLCSNCHRTVHATSHDE